MKKTNDSRTPSANPANSKMRGTPVNLPPCGIWFGSGVYPMSKDYLLGVMIGHQSWAPQRFHPLEMIDKIAEDNQGNLAQVWGGARGYAASTYAEWHYALDEIGIHVADPDWSIPSGYSYRQDPDIQAHPERWGAGFLRFMKAAAEKGIYTTFIYTQANDEWVKRFSEVGDYYLGYNFGERFSFRLSSPVFQGRDPSTITLKDLADDLIARVREHVEDMRARGWGNIMATSSNFHIDYEVEAGTDIPLIEDFAFCHLNLASALSRGLYRQYHLPMWGTHIAHEHYSWLPHKSKYRYALLRAAFFQKYMSGAKMIINESGNWFVEATKAEDSPKHEFPRVPLKIEDAPWGGTEKPPKFIPYIEEARKYYHLMDYTSEICKRYRKECSDFYDFIKAHGTPSGQPESTMAIAKGRYDLCNHRYMPNHAIGGASTIAEKDIRWYHGIPERSWELVRKEFFPLKNVIGKFPNMFLSGTPYGMVDVVTFLQEDLSADVLLTHYRSLIFSGWNSATDKHYQVLLDYVKDGGCLFLAIPHLCRNVSRNFSDYGVEELVNNGDFSELCGVKVTGRGSRFYWGIPPVGSDAMGFRFPRRFGIAAMPHGLIDIVDSSAEILLVDDERSYPLLLRRKCGKGEVYFLNSWAHPGAWEQDDGPGGRVGSTGLMGYIFRHFAKLSRGDVWITDDGTDPCEECDYIAFSHFPDSKHICLQNVDFENGKSFVLHRFGNNDSVSLEAGEFRLLDATSGKIIASDKTILSDDLK